MMTANATTIPFLLAFAVGIALVVLALRMQKSDVIQSFDNREQVLERKVSEMRDEIEHLKTAMTLLQGLLYDKQKEVEAQRKEISELRERIRQLEQGLSQSDTSMPKSGRQVLWACIGDDPILKQDLAGLRRVQAQTRTRLATLDPVTMKDLEAALDRERRNQTPIQFLHLGVHSDQNGLFFADGVATWDWLSERLAGVQVLLLAGCSNDRLADKLRVVDAIISVRARDIQSNDASQFVEAFWMAFLSQKGWTPSQAFDKALEVAPARVGEFVQLHL